MKKVDTKQKPISVSVKKNTPKKVLVIGSMNVDMVVKTSRIPRAGETLLGGVFNQYEGGKGANQAAASNMLWAHTSFCAGVGDDSLGRDYLKYLKGKKLDVSLVKLFKDAHTGVALITVAKEGQNVITVAPGANMLLSPDDMKAIDFSKYSYVAFQLENQLETVAEGLKLAKAAGCITILTPAPSRLLPDEIFQCVDYLIPNEIEVLQLLRGYTSMNTAAVALLKKGVKNVLVTLGANGCMLFNENGQVHYPAPSVRPIDTVGAGDCFTGSFMAGLKIYEGDVESAIKMANAAAGLSVTKMGAQSHASLDEVQKFMKKRAR